jgi:tetratricopeptide (TPR) repeat protein
VKTAAIALASILSVFSPARREAKKGAAAYGKKDYPEAARRFGEAARRDPADGAWSLDLGTSLGAAGRGADAHAPLDDAARSSDRAVAADALYQQGTLALREGDWRSAADALRRSLILDPARPDAQRNYEIAWRKLQEKQPPPPPSPSPSPGATPTSPQKKPSSPPPRPRPGENDDEFRKRAGMSRRDAEALLRSLDAEQRQREKTAPAVTGRDW